MTDLLAEHSIIWLSGLLLALLATGAVAGLMAGLLGIGGGLVIVPMLYYLFDLLGISPAVTMHVAIGTSLATIIVTSLRSARARYQRGNLDPELLRALAPGIVLGVVLGSLVSGALSGEGLSLIFALIVLLVALNMITQKKPRTLGDSLPTGARRHGITTGIGVVSALMGIGGATLSVPFLTAFRVPIHRAVGTAAALGVVIGLPGTFVYFWTGIGVPGRPPLSLGYVNLVGLFLIIPVTFFMAPLGARLASVINAEWLRRIFALFLCATAARMLYGLIAA